MKDADKNLSIALGGKTIIHAHEHNGHGDVLRLDFSDGTEFYVWAFDKPDDLQGVLYSPKDGRDGKIVADFREDACVEDFEARRKDMESRRIGGRPDTFPFSTYHRKSIT